MSKTLFLLSLPIALVLFVYPEQLLDWIYGAGKFTEAIPVLRIFAGITFLHFSGIFYALLLTTVGRQSTRMRIVIFATVLNFSLNAYFIPKYGPIGAAIVSLVTIAFVNTAYANAMRRLFMQWVFNFRYGATFALTMVIAFSLWQVRGLSLVYMLPLIVGIYGAMFYFIGYSKEERAWIFGGNLQLVFSGKSADRGVDVFND